MKDKEGTVNYYPNVLTYDDETRYFDLLLQKIVWENDEVIIFGKHIVTKRKVAWYGDSNYSYTTTKQALPWTKELFELKQIAEKLTETKFNSCLLNLYHSKGMGWNFMFIALYARMWIFLFISNPLYLLHCSTCVPYIPVSYIVPISYILIGLPANAHRELVTNAFMFSATGYNNTIYLHMLVLNMVL